MVRVWAALAVVTCLPIASAQPRVTSVVNGGSFQAPVAPGSFAAIIGQGLSSATLTAPTTTWPLELGGVTVAVGGQPAPLYDVSPTQINFQVPRTIAPGQATVVVRVSAASSAPVTFAVAAAAPGMLVFGSNQGVAARVDGSIVTPQNPANPGSLVTLYLTGIGPVDNPAADGAPTQSSPLARASLPHSAAIGGRPAAVSFLGLTPGFVGLAQANLTVPDDLPPGNHGIVLTVGGNRSNTTAPVLAVDNPPRIQSLSTGVGAPGTEVTVSGISVPGGTQVKSILIEFDDGGMVPAAPSVSGGRVSFLVPFVPDPEAAGGYRTGNCSISFYNGATTSNALPFRIEPLAKPADPVGRFKAIVQSLAASSAANLNAQKAIAEFTPLASVIDPLSQTRTAALLALADQIAANGRATLPLDLSGPAEPGAPMVEVTLRDLENLVAVLDQSKAEAAQSSDAPRAILPRAGAAGPCLFDLPGYQYCTILAQSPDAYSEGMTSGPLFRMIANAFTVGPQNYKAQRVLCTINPAAISPFVIASSLLQYLNDRRLTCKLQPTKPVSITALPVPNPIPAGSFETTGNRGTGLTIRLEPFWTPEFTVDQVLGSVYGETFEAAIPYPDQCARDLRADLGRIARDMFNRARDRMVESLRRVSPEKSREVPLYKCDISDVQPASSSTTLASHRADKDDAGSNRWGIEGKLPGSASLTLTPVWDHFLPDLFTTTPTDPCFQSSGSNLTVSLMGDFKQLNPCVRVEVAGPRKAVEVTGSQVFSFTSATGPLNRSSFNPPVRVTQEAPFQRADAAQGAISQLQVEQLTATKYRVTQIVEGASASTKEIVNTWNGVTLLLTNGPGSHKIRIQLKSNVSGACQGMHADLNARTRDRQDDEGNNGCARTWDMNNFSSTTSLTTLDLGVYILGGQGLGFGPGKGTVTTEIELLDDVQ